MVLEQSLLEVLVVAVVEMVKTDVFLLEVEVVLKMQVIILL